MCRFLQRGPSQRDLPKNTRKNEGPGGGGYRSAWPAAFRDVYMVSSSVNVLKHSSPSVMDRVLHTSHTPITWSRTSRRNAGRVIYCAASRDRARSFCNLSTPRGLFPWIGD